MSETAENCLKTIEALQKRLEKVRIIDLLLEPDCPKSSINSILKQLQEGGYLKIDADNCISLLTPDHRRESSAPSRRLLLTRLFVYLGVAQQTAESDAQKIEALLSTETYEKIREYLEAQEIFRAPALSQLKRE